MIVTAMSFLLAAATAPAAPEEILLWPGGAPGSEGQTAPEVVTVTDGVRRITAVHKPSIAVYLPAKETATGAGVVVLPGGAHHHLAIDNEGHAVAKWLAEHGIAAFVLKYRLARADGSIYKVDVHEMDDTRRALRLVRSRAGKWNLDPARVGMMGFSAGGELVARAALAFDAGKRDAKDPIERESAKPAFQVLMYPGGLKEEMAVPKDAPPAFLCAAYDDKGPSRGAVMLFGKLREAGVTAELHVFSKGGHGFGMKDRPLPITTWPVRLRDWLQAEGFLASHLAAKP
ncbi:MAG TPA: alpha/beta hydrolase [Polyangia bacterium]|nr:alpha/beta hydrolase [Polyangia bacterium]